MSILANWKIYTIFATVLVVFYFMYTAKIAEIATLAAANKTLIENIEVQKKLVKLKDELIVNQDKILSENREELGKAQQQLTDLENKVETKPGAESDASPYLKDFFKDLGDVK